MATDFERLRAMKDEDIDCSDIPEMTDEEIRNAESILVTPGRETAFLAISSEIMSYFKKGGKGYMMRLSHLVEDMLRDYVNSHQEAEGVMQ